LEIREALCSKIINYIKNDPRAIYLDADLMTSIGIIKYREQYPNRIIDCGIQEANMVGVAAGLSMINMIPFIHTFAAFASRRVFDQIFLSCAYAKLNVNIIGSDPGITASYNGGTHMALEDIGLFRTIPKAIIVDPTDVFVMEQILDQIYSDYGVHYIRLSRKQTFTVYNGNEKFVLGKALRIRDGQDITIIASGGLCVKGALDAAEKLKTYGISARVLDMFTIKPLDREAVMCASRETGGIITVENHNICGGLGSAVAEVLSENTPTTLIRLGVNEQFGIVGSVDFLARHFGLDDKTIVEAALKLV